ncbi:MAG: hypothetical protein QF654_15395 [Alphaproteobacteria bacterium]|nr:hypothetical protein [Alphaproteobacteria bacterium]
MAEPPELDDLARRYLDLWQQHMAEVAADPEFLDAMSRLFAAFNPAGNPAANPFMNPMGTPAANPFANLQAMNPQANNPQSMNAMMDPAAWMAALGTAMPAPSTPGSTSRDRASSAAKARRTAAAAAPSDGGGDGLRELERRRAGLEERLDRLEAAPKGGGKGARGGAKKRKS